MRRRTLGILLVGLSLLAACNEPPTAVGTAVVFDTTHVGQLSSDTLPLISATTKLDIPGYLFNAGVLFIGRTSQLHATTLLRFTTLPDTLGWVGTQDILGAKLLLRPHRYVVGDSVSNVLAFTVYELTRPWITADSAGNVVIEPRWYDLFSTGGVPSPQYFDQTPLAIFDGSQKIPLTDSLSDIEVPLTNDGLQRVARWLQMRTDSVQRTQIYGIGFVPGANSTVVREFETQTTGSPFGALVRLRIYYRRQDGSTDSVLVFSGNDATFVHATAPSNGTLPVQSVVRSEVAMTLDLSVLPTLNAILNAQLTVVTDTTERIASNSSIPSTLELAYIDSTTNRQIGFVGGQLAGSSRFVFPNVGPLVDYLRQRKQGRGTVLLRSRNFRLERVAIYGANAPDSLRPRLVITYIPRPTVP
ncbi:MAG: hypothetical protein N2663_01305 [Chlorobi bacterium]|nr:hypothetical protein [Chlorobiota bacterium]